MSSTCFLLLLLCFSLHACEAHPLETHFFPKNEGENGFGDSSAQKLIGMKNDGDEVVKPEFVADIEKPKENENIYKNEDVNPKHTLDYDYPPPDVHPPSHNSP